MSASDDAEASMISKLKQVNSVVVYRLQIVSLLKGKCLVYFICYLPGMWV